MSTEQTPEHRAEPSHDLEALGYRVTARKALAAGIGAGVAGIGAACADGVVTWPEVIVAAGLALTTAATTWRVAFATLNRPE